MRVQFDLRPVSLLEKERKRTSFNITRLLAILLFLFFIASNGFYLVTMAMKMMNLQEGIFLKEDEVSSLEVRKTELESEIKRLQDREKVFSETLKIMQEDLPTLEVFNALETHMDYGVGLNSIRFSAGRVMGNVKGPDIAVVEATAATEEQIIQLTEGLTGSGVFSSVVMPNSTRDDKTGRVTFTLNLSLLPIGQITSSATR